MRIFTVYFFLTSISILNAQDLLNTWSVGVGVNTFESFENQSWQSNIYYPTLSLHRYASEEISFGVRYSTNTIKTHKKNSNYCSADILLKYNIDHLFPHMIKFNPYLEAAAGFTFIEKLHTINTTITAGLTYWFSRFFGVTVQASTRGDFLDNGIGGMQYVVGINIRFGGVDSDKDSVLDKIDVCPNIFGLPFLRGCPDTDGDGIEDIKDDCPNTVGKPYLRGCPDQDSDGIADIEDLCPSIEGLLSLKGCPDVDHDGIVDNEDKCPKKAGTLENKGCPWFDGDGDTVPDRIDLCPKQYGSVATNGCPEKFSQELQNKVNEYAKVILFKTGNKEIAKESEQVLRAIANIIIDFSDVSFSVEGHTDNNGSDILNLSLSKDRANAVRDYLISLGISPKSLTAVGYGETRPISTNTTEAGRKENRRVEINIIRSTN